MKILASLFIFNTNTASQHEYIIYRFKIPNLLNLKIIVMMLWERNMGARWKLIKYQGSIRIYCCFNTTKICKKEEIKRREKKSRIRQ
jgi:hypothetical protein